MRNAGYELESERFQAQTQEDSAANNLTEWEYLFIQSFSCVLKCIINK